MDQIIKKDQKGMNDVPPSYDFPVFFYVSYVFTLSKQSKAKCFAVRYVRLKSVLPRSDFLHPVMELRGGRKHGGIRGILPDMVWKTKIP